MCVCFLPLHATNRCHLNGRIVFALSRSHCASYVRVMCKRSVTARREFVSCWDFCAPQNVQRAHICRHYLCWHASVYFRTPLFHVGTRSLIATAPSGVSYTRHPLELTLQLFSTLLLYFLLSIGFLVALFDSPLQGVWTMTHTRCSLGVISAWVIMLTALTVRAKKWPECAHPRRFDMLGASHQCFHAMAATSPLLLLRWYAEMFEAGDFTVATLCGDKRG